MQYNIALKTAVKASTYSVLSNHILSKWQRPSKLQFGKTSKQYTKNHRAAVKILD